MPLFGPPNIKKLEDRRDVKGLIKALSYPQNAAVRQLAARALGESNDTLAEEALIAALKDPDPHVREIAVKSLGKHGHRRNVEPLIAALKDSHASVRRAASQALGKIGDSRAVDSLIAALQDSDGYTCQNAVEALGKITAASAVEPLIAVFQNTKRETYLRREAAKALGLIGDPRALEVLIAALKDDRNVRHEVADALGKLGWKPGKDETGAYYWIAKQMYPMCVEIGPPALSPLINELKVKGERARWQAVEVLGKIGDARAVEPLIAVLNDRDQSVRWFAEKALGNIGSPVVEPLINVLVQGFQGGRSSYAARILGIIGDARAVEPLLSALKESDVGLRQEAAVALDKLGWQPRQDMAGAYFWAAKQDWPACKQVGAEALQPLLAALLVNDWVVRQHAAEALGEVGEASAIEPLIAALDDKIAPVRRSAARALVSLYQTGKLDDPSRGLLLAQREKMAQPHVDNQHECGGHTDRGIGIDFGL